MNYGCEGSADVQVHGELIERDRLFSRSCVASIRISIILPALKMVRLTSALA